MRGSQCHSVPLDSGKTRLNDVNTYHHTNNTSSLILILGYVSRIKLGIGFVDIHIYHAFRKQTMFRMLTARLRGLPDFIIIGAMKTGSTSLYGFVVQHPAIAPAAKKTLQYFFRNYEFGELWYRSNFPTNLQRYSFYKKTNQKLISGEASPTYFFYPTVPGRMKKILPNVKLIVILRNPVDRAYSHYYHTKRLHGETLSFDKAIELEEERCAERERATDQRSIFFSFPLQRALLSC